MTSSTISMATSLNQAFNSTTLNLPALNQLLSNGTVHVNFWGNRQVTVRGYSDTIELNALANRMLDLIRSNHETFNEADCRSGLECVQKIRGFYKLSDDMINNGPFIARICAVFREFIELMGVLFDPYGHTKRPRGCIEINDEVYTIGPYPIKATLEERLRRIAEEQRKHEQMMRARSGPTPPERLQNFAELLASSTTTDNEVRKQFYELPRTYMNHIKKKMWLDAGGSSNPQFAANQSDWAEDQIQDRNSMVHQGTNPFPRKLLSDAVQFYLTETTLINTTAPEGMRIQLGGIDILESERRKDENETLEEGTFGFTNRIALRDIMIKTQEC